MSNMIKGAYPVFTDIDGSPIEDGYIFIGEPALDPVANPISVYWDEELTVPATNIRTKGGYPNNSGAPGRLFVEGTYSILVQNKRGTEVYSETTFFEAGAELSFEDSNVYFPNVSARKKDGNTLYMSIDWDENPKIGTGFTFSNPTNLIFEDGAGASVTLVSPSYSNFGVKKKRITFELTDTGLFAGVTANRNISMRASSVTVVGTIL